MKALRSYPTYAHAEDDQLTLLASDIDALVEYVPSPPLELAHLQRRSGYVLMVDEERFEDAFRLLTPMPDATHCCIFACPNCGSENAVEREPSALLGALTFQITAVIHILRTKRSGAPFVCLSCGHRYRKKPTDT